MRIILVDKMKRNLDGNRITFWDEGGWPGSKFFYNLSRTVVPVAFLGGIQPVAVPAPQPLCNGIWPKSPDRYWIGLIVISTSQKR